MRTRLPLANPGTGAPNLAGAFLPPPGQHVGAASTPMPAKTIQ
ncbi:MAG: hypothetical protein ACKODH_06640 [Limisphaerales bacterium]